MEYVGDKYNISHRNRQKPLRNIESTIAHASNNGGVNWQRFHISRTVRDIGDIRGCSDYATGRSITSYIFIQGAKVVQIEQNTKEIALFLSFFEPMEQQRHQVCSNDRVTEVDMVKCTLLSRQASKSVDFFYTPKGITENILWTHLLFFVKWFVVSKTMTLTSSHTSFPHAHTRPSVAAHPVYDGPGGRREKKKNSNDCCQKIGCG